MRKGMICSILILILFTANGMSMAKELEIVSSPWAPYYGEELPNYGVSAEIVQAAYENHGYKVKFKFLPWKRCLKELKYGEHDAILNAYYEKNRTKTFLFSEPYLQTELVFFKRRGEAPNEWKTLEDLKPYIIGVISGSVYTPEFDAAEFLNKEDVETDVQNLGKLLLRRIDLIPLTPIVGTYLIDVHLPKDKDKFEILLPPLDDGRNLYLMFSLKDLHAREKARIFNDGLKKIKKDGMIHNILKKYTLN